MANQDHLDILMRGVEVWNKWRQENPEILPNLRGVDLGRADLCRVNLSDANLTEATLSESNLSDSDLRRALLDGTNFTSANLMRATLSQANLSGANLSKTNLFGAILIGTIFHNTDLEGADFSHCEFAFTMLGNVDLSTAKGLEIVHHVGSSSIDIDTFYRSSGKIPDVFLRGVGVPNPFIENIPILLGAMNPIDFSSCFISYSSKDQAFAERLYADLQSVGVRCWFAPEDLRIGENFPKKIDDAIQLFDRLLLILSEHSISSEWVEIEVERALTKELEQKRAIVFPLRLDNSVLESTSKWSNELIQTRHIGDFRYWKQHDEYRQAFARLIRDLTLSVVQEPNKQERTV